MTYRAGFHKGLTVAGGYRRGRIREGGGKRPQVQRLMHCDRYWSSGLLQYEHGVSRPDHHRTWELVRLLSDIFPDAAHVTNEGLGSRPDLDVWEFATGNTSAVVTKDRDFRVLALLGELPLKVIHLAIGNSTTAECERALRRNRERIEEFLKSSATLLIIERL